MTAEQRADFTNEDLHTLRHVASGGRGAVIDRRLAARTAYHIELLEADLAALRSVTRHLLADYQPMRLVNGSEWWHPSEDDDGLHEPMTGAERAALDALQKDDP